jgi:hypothetical protein
MAINDNDATVAEQLQMILALKATDPDLEKAWQAYLKGDMDGFRSFVLGSA